MTIHSQVNPNFPMVNDIHPEDAKSLLQDNEITWIDVRSPEEYLGELSHIQGTTLIPLDQIPQQVSTLPKEGVKIFVCRSGQRSAKACEYLQNLGYSQCYNLSGGMLLWNQLQFPIEGK